MKGYIKTQSSKSNTTLLHKALLSSLLLITMLFVNSCDSRQKDGLPAGDSIVNEEVYPTAEEMLRDSIAKKEEVSNACATICLRMIQTEEMLSAVKSPDALISAKKEYLMLMASIKKELSSISKQEQNTALAYKENLDRAYLSTCREYEIPANGVISNLNNLIRQIDNVHTPSELIRFQDVRIGMLRKLDDLYLCVDHNSNSIAEVKRLAQTLKRKYENKKQELGMD